MSIYGSRREEEGQSRGNSNRVTDESNLWFSAVRRWPELLGTSGLALREVSSQSLGQSEHLSWKKFWTQFDDDDDDDAAGVAGDLLSFLRETTRPTSTITMHPHLFTKDNVGTSIRPPSLPAHSPYLPSIER